MTIITKKDNGAPIEWERIRLFQITSLELFLPQVYIPKRRTLIQVLAPANAHTKSAHAYIHFAYMHEQIT